ncbi:MAG: sigma 54-interacting transcriptional regulator [Planctomycetaceae bacterium]|nr:sigma 54-interacting transcriptional regulator [Planctomycetaceae bacterium]
MIERPIEQIGDPASAAIQGLAKRANDESPCDFRVLCDRSLAGIYVVRTGRIAYANLALGELLGCDPSEIVGQSPLSFVHPDDRAEVEEQMRRRLSGESETSRFVMRIVRADGNIAEVEVLGTRLPDESAPGLMGTMIEVTARKRADQKIQELANFERLLANLSAGFINLNCDQIDDHIDASLKSLVEFLGNDRSTFVEFGDDDEYVLVTHSIVTPGGDPFPLGRFQVARLPWFINQFRKGQRVFVRDVETDLPSDATEERKFCARHGIKSNVTLPLKAGGLLLGGLTFAFLRNRCEWPIEIISRLQLIGEVFANALLRRRTELALRSALAENDTLRQRLEEENLYLRERIVLKHHHGRIIGRSDAIMQVLADAERVAATDAPVLLTGETGTGKELLAQTIHELSKRKDRQMVIVNCASLPATLIESELFGRAAGAYTGAASAQIGRFELANGSTLFLDEIGEFPLELQAKLLRVLQDGRFERLGSPTTISVDVRIIAATNRDLEVAVSEGTFREDLYHRLNVFPIRVPPLRERRDDIPPLTWAFVESFGRRMGKAIKRIPRKTMQRLQQNDWPGNVRELSNAIERAIILATDDTLHVETRTARHARESRLTLKENERAQILRVLRDTGWRIRGNGGAAEFLDIKPTTLEARMAKLGIKRPNRP